MLRRPIETTPFIRTWENAPRPVESVDFLNWTMRVVQMVRRLPGQYQAALWRRHDAYALFGLDPKNGLL